MGAFRDFAMPGGWLRTGTVAELYSERNWNEKGNTLTLKCMESIRPERVAKYIRQYFQQCDGLGSFILRGPSHPLNHFAPARFHT